MSEYLIWVVHAINVLSNLGTLLWVMVLYNSSKDGYLNHKVVYFTIICILWSVFIPSKEIMGLMLIK